VIKLDARKNF